MYNLIGLNSAEMFDTRTQEWRMIASMSTRRSSVGVGVVNGMLYAVGRDDKQSKSCPEFIFLSSDFFFTLS